MKTEARIIVRSRDSGSEAVSELASIYPQWLEGDKFVCRLPWNDERVKQIMDHVAARGLKPRGRRPDPEDYSLKIERTYSRGDLKESAYLTFTAKTLFLGQTRAPDGIIELKANEIRADADFASATRPWVLVSDRVKELLEGEELEHVAFLETRILDPAGRPSVRIKSRFWELTSDLLLPPMDDPCKFVHARTEEEVSGDCAEPFVMREGLEVPGYLYEPAEPHYNAEQLRSVGPFDLSRTCERMFGGDSGGPLICSGRFYRFCEENRLDRKLHWVPVRINPT